MNKPTLEISQTYINIRRGHPAWQLLASHRAPLLLGCLKTLFDQSQQGINLDDALQLLTELLAQHANNDEFDITAQDHAALARKELRDWIKRGLVVEREGTLLATDALQRTLEFVNGLDQCLMTTTASRLATVQREIENLDTRLNPDPQSRAISLQSKIKELEAELTRVAAGQFDVLTGQQAIEGIREVYNLAMSLRADFRRVEDSYREADRQLRQAIISETHHRGSIVDSLLDSHEQLLETPEGQVFHGFYSQLRSTVELDNMKHRVRNILGNPEIDQALTRRQQAELRWLVTQLVKDSENVIRARSRSERDVKSFVKNGLAAEHHRVGELLRELLKTALDVDWASTTLRRTAVPLPPIGISLAGLPLVERLLCKSLEPDDQAPLELAEQLVDLDELDDAFWTSFDSLDRAALLQETRRTLNDAGRPLTLAELASLQPPTHDLETLTCWLGMAREAELPFPNSYEILEVTGRDGTSLRFHVPRVALSAMALAGIQWDA